MVNLKPQMNLSVYNGLTVYDDANYNPNDSNRLICNLILITSLEKAISTLCTIFICLSLLF